MRNSSSAIVTVSLLSVDCDRHFAQSPSLYMPTTIQFPNEWRVKCSILTLVDISAVSDNMLKVPDSLENLGKNNTREDPAMATFKCTTFAFDETADSVQETYPVPEVGDVPRVDTLVVDSATIAIKGGEISTVRSILLRNETYCCSGYTYPNSDLHSSSVLKRHRQELFGETFDNPPISSKTNAGEEEFYLGTWPTHGIKTASFLEILQLPHQSPLILVSGYYNPYRGVDIQGLSYHLDAGRHFGREFARRYLPRADVLVQPSISFTESTGKLPGLLPVDFESIEPMLPHLSEVQPEILSKTSSYMAALLCHKMVKSLTPLSNLKGYVPS